MKQPLAIVGASTRSAAASALRAGFQPLAADLFADDDLRHIATATRIRPYPEGLLDWLRAVEPPMWMYTGALENHPELVDEMAWIAPLAGNPGDVLARVRSPWELSRALYNAGLLFPETRDTADGLPLDGAWLAKTYRGASGSGVRILSEDQGAGSIEEESSVCAYQRRIDGMPCAAVYVAAGGASQLLGVTRQLIGEPWLGAHGFRYAGSIGPFNIAEKSRATLVQLGNVLASEFEMVGLFGVDFILAADEIWVLEVNPRYTASVEIVERFTSVHAIEAHVAACTENIAPQRAGPTPAPRGGGDAPARSSPVCHGKAIVFAKRDLLISKTFADETLAEATDTPWPMLADVSAAESPIEAGRPVLTVFAAGASVEEVEQNLRRRVVEIEEKLYT